MADEEIDTSDISELDDEFFAQAELRIPKDRHSVLLSIDEDTYEWFAEQGPDFRFRMNAALKIYADAHR